MPVAGLSRRDVLVGVKLRQNPCNLVLSVQLGAMRCNGAGRLDALSGGLFIFAHHFRQSLFVRFSRGKHSGTRRSGLLGGTGVFLRKLSHLGGGPGEGGPEEAVVLQSLMAATWFGFGGYEPRAAHAVLYKYG